MKLFAVILLTFSFISCGKNSSFESPMELITSYTAEEIESVEELLYEYELEVDDCSTGYHSHETLEGICGILLDDKLNNYCAYEDRESLALSAQCDLI